MIARTGAHPFEQAAPPASIYADRLTEGVMLRRLIAWLLDGLLIVLLLGVLWLGGIVFGVLTLGLGFPLLHLLPLVPFAYNFACLAGPLSGTPGQRMMDLVVRRDRDLGQPTSTEALISVAAFYVTLLFGAIWICVALFTTRHRTPHDLLAGLVVVRARALQDWTEREALLTAGAGDWNMRFGGPSNA